MTIELTHHTETITVVCHTPSYGDFLEELKETNSTEIIVHSVLYPRQMLIHLTQIVPLFPIVYVSNDGTYKLLVPSRFRHRTE